MSRLALDVLPQPGPIADAVGRVSAFLESSGVDPTTVHHACLVVEELVTNVGTHGGAFDDPAQVLVVIVPARVAITVQDKGRPFDPRSAPEPDTSLPVEDRPIGGLGLLLVRKLATTLDYRRIKDQNCTHIVLPRPATSGEPPNDA